MEEAGLLINEAQLSMILKQFGGPPSKKLSTTILFPHLNPDGTADQNSIIDTFSLISYRNKMDSPERWQLNVEHI